MRQKQQPEREAHFDIYSSKGSSLEIHPDPDDNHSKR
jgi:hypothetical protein